MKYGRWKSDASILQWEVMGSAAASWAHRAMRSRQLMANVPIREKLIDFCRKAITDNSNVNS